MSEPSYNISKCIFSDLKSKDHSAHFRCSIDGQQSDLGRQGLSSSCIKPYPIMRKFQCHEELRRMEKKKGELELLCVCAVKKEKRHS